MRRPSRSAAIGLVALGVVGCALNPRPEDPGAGSPSGAGPGIGASDGTGTAGAGGAPTDPLFGIGGAAAPPPSPAEAGAVKESDAAEMIGDAGPHAADAGSVADSKTVD